MFGFAFVGRRRKPAPPSTPPRPSPNAPPPQRMVPEPTKPLPVRPEPSTSETAPDGPLGGLLPELPPAPPEPPTPPEDVMDGPSPEDDSELSTVPDITTFDVELDTPNETGTAVATVPPQMTGPTFLMIADLSARSLVVKKDGAVIRMFNNLEYSRVGTIEPPNAVWQETAYREDRENWESSDDNAEGLGSNKTPLGEFGVTKEPNHSYGPTLRLSGFQGHRRGILVHQDNTRDSGSAGCLHLDKEDMYELFSLVPDSGARLEIQW